MIPPQLRSYCNDLSQSINLLWANNNYYPALMLLYIMIDTGGWIKNGNKSSEKNFKSWVSEFIDKKEIGGATPDDLWSERCGLLHIFSHNTWSFQGKDGKSARAAAYYFPDGDPRIIKKLARDKKIEEKTVIIEADKLKNSIIGGFESMILEFSVRKINRNQIKRINEMNYYFYAGNIPGNA